MSLSISACFVLKWPCLWWLCLFPWRNFLEGWFLDWSIKDWIKSLSTRSDTNLRSVSLALSTLSSTKLKVSISRVSSNKFGNIPLGDAICRVDAMTKVNKRTYVLIFVCLGQKPQSKWGAAQFQANLSLSECQNQSRPDLIRGFTARISYSKLRLIAWFTPPP